MMVESLNEPRRIEASDIGRQRIEVPSDNQRNHCPEFFGAEPIPAARDICCLGLRMEFGRYHFSESIGVARKLTGSIKGMEGLMPECGPIKPMLPPADFDHVGLEVIASAAGISRAVPLLTTLSEPYVNSSQDGSTLGREHVPEGPIGPNRVYRERCSGQENEHWEKDEQAFHAPIIARPRPVVPDIWRTKGL